MSSRISVRVLDHADYMERRDPRQTGGDPEWLLPVYIHGRIVERRTLGPVYEMIQVHIPNMVVKIPEHLAVFPPMRQTRRRNIREPGACLDKEGLRRWLLCANNTPWQSMIHGDHASRRVYVDQWRVRPNHSQRVYSHSPDGFNWGYGGSGPAQLALALMLLYCEEEDALAIYQAFKREFVAQWHPEFVCSEKQVLRWIERELGGRGE